MLFPEHWREVIVRKEEKIHIADVMLANGLVIEFQNSSISMDTITLREKFYNTMIWIVNAEKFIDNFRLRSIVNTQLAEVERLSSFELHGLSNLFDFELNSIKEQVEKIENEISWKLENINSKTGKVTNLIAIDNNFDGFLADATDWYLGKKRWWDLETFDVLKLIQDTDLEDLAKDYQEMASVQENMKADAPTLTRINKLEVFEVDGKEFKIVSYDKLKSKNYFKIKAILKTSRFTALPKIECFNSDIEFLSHGEKKEKYDYAIDSSDEISKLTDDRVEQTKRLSELQISIELKTRILRDRLRPYIIDRVKLANNELSIMHNGQRVLENRKNALLDTKLEIELKRIQEIEIRSAGILKNKENKRLAVEAQMKDLYTFEWRNERKSWRAALCPVFFDVGKEYLYQRIDNITFKKIRKAEFVGTMSI